MVFLFAYLRRLSTCVWRACGRLQPKTTTGRITSVFYIKKKYLTFSVYKIVQEFTVNKDNVGDDIVEVTNGWNFGGIRWSTGGF